MTQSASEKKLWIDVLTVISCFAVVMLHTNMKAFWLRPDGRLWLTATLIETLFYYAVPVFFMITGYTLMDYRQRYNTATFLQKRIKRTVIPFLFWSLFGLWLYYAKYSLLPDETITALTGGILAHRYTEIYWFFIPLFAVYLSLPFFSLIPLETRPQAFRYALLYGFISYGILPVASRLGGIDYDPAIAAPFLGGYLFYALLGYCLGTYPIPRRLRIMLYLLGIGGFLIHYLGTLCLSPPDKVDDTYKGYLNFPCVLYASAIFTWCRYHDYRWLQQHRHALRLLGVLKNAALGVYLLHIYLIWQIPEWLDPIGTAAAQSAHTASALEKSIAFRTIGALGIYCACVAISHLFRRIPLLRALIP